MMPEVPFDLPAICEAIATHKFKRVVLQFPDEHLIYCADIYEYMLDALNPDSSIKIEDDSDHVDVFISADSTYGSSVDDVSADHVDAEVLIYFGSDLSSSGTMPVLVAPKRVDVDAADGATKIFEAISAYISERGNESLSNNKLNAVVLYEPGCAEGTVSLHSILSQSLEQHMECASGTCNSALGGLLVPASVHSDPACILIYVGDKESQMQSITLQLGLHQLIAYSPTLQQVRSITGAHTRPFRERYGGISRVADANIIGIIVGSMGLTGERTKEIIERVQAICVAGGKKTYTFIMGRLNEAKLCNFPEADLFCFISNEDVGVIPAKTFHVPVLTPWELEIGLGAREWSSSYMSSPMAVLQDTQTASTGTAEGDDDDGADLRNDLPSVLRRVRRHYRREHGLDSSSEEEEGGGGGGGGG
eukprot:GSChrysophyteH1.ASY1.ANO1.1342.1 assembled CDS